MTDRELVEAAAKAAGLWDYREQCIDIPWNPLHDDGDAFRLAVKLGVGIEWWGSMPNGIAGRINFDGNGVILMENVNDRALMLRRAIVRAAASCSTHHV